AGLPARAAGRGGPDAVGAHARGPARPRELRPRLDGPHTLALAGPWALRARLEPALRAPRHRGLRLSVAHRPAGPGLAPRAPAGVERRRWRCASTRSTAAGRRGRSVSSSPASTAASASPTQCYLIDHPKGKVLFDSGLHVDLQHDPAARLGTIATVFDV